MKKTLFLFFLILTVSFLSIPRANAVSFFSYQVDGNPVYVGDPGKSEFTPTLILTKDNAYLKLILDNSLFKTESVSLASDTVKYSCEKYDINFYAKSRDTFEYEFFIHEKLESNILELRLESKGLDYFYQPLLTEELNPREYDFLNETHAIIKDQVIYERPEGYAGSYAVYLSEKSQGTGKAFTIFRPWIIDSLGKKAWCNQKIAGDLFSIEIPQAFLDSAIYPLTLDPTFGYTTEGGSMWLNRGPDLITGSTDGSTIAGEITKITVRLYIPNGAVVKCAIYDDSGNLEGGTTARTWSFGLTWAWAEFTFSANPTVGSDIYYWRIWSDITGAKDGNIYLKYDSSISGYTSDDKAASYNGWPDPYSPDNSYNQRALSGYATYTAAGSLYNAAVSVGYTLADSVSRLWDGSRSVGSSLLYVLGGTRIGEQGRVGSDLFTFVLGDSRLFEGTRSATEGLTFVFGVAASVLGSYFRYVSETFTFVEGVAIAISGNYLRSVSKAFHFFLSNSILSPFVSVDLGAIAFILALVALCLVVIGKTYYD